MTTDSSAHSVSRGQAAIKSLSATTRTLRGQSAIEYLLTYGWAILAILVCLAALIYFGVLSPSMMAPSKCVFPQDLNCQAYQLNASGNITLDISQAIGGNIEITAVKCTQEINPSFNASDVLISPIAINNTKHALISSQCYSLVNGQPTLTSGQAGETYKGKVYIQYHEVDSGFTRTVAGEVVLRFEDLTIPSASSTLTPTPTPTSTPTPPVAEFACVPLSGIASLSVTCTDASTNTPTSWNWNYKETEGSWTQFSTSQNPTFSLAAGTYSINLTATNAGGSDTKSRAGYIAVTAPDLAYPTFSTNSTNTTIAGASTLFSLAWADNVALSGYIFSFDNGTGTFVNDSWVAMTGASDWSNVTKTVNSVAGSTIRWCAYANDTSNNFNDSCATPFSYATTVSLPAYTAKWTFDTTVLKEENNLYNWSFNSGNSSPNQSSVVRSGATGYSVEFDGIEPSPAGPEGGGWNQDAPVGNGHFLYRAQVIGSGNVSGGMWVQILNTTKSGAFYWERGTNYGWHVGYDGDTGKVYFSSYTTGPTSTVTINDGNWHYIAFRRNGTCYLWVDGVLSGTPVACTGATGMARLGAIRNNNIIPRARIDDFVLYNSALTDEQITHGLYQP